MIRQRAVAWVLRHSPTRGAERLVLMALAEISDRLGRSFPSRRYLAQCTGLELVTLGRVLQRLEDFQHIDADRSAGRCAVLTIVVDAERVGRSRSVAP